MTQKLLIGLLLGVVLKIVSSVETSRNAEGYPYGYLSDCPGVTKPAVISKSSLRRLRFIHLQGSHFLTATQKEYNYYQMKQLARNLNFRNKTILYMNGYMDSTYFMPITRAMGCMYSRRGYNVLLLEYIDFSAATYPICRGGRGSRINPSNSARGCCKSLTRRRAAAYFCVLSNIITAITNPPAKRGDYGKTLQFWRRLCPTVDTLAVEEDSHVAARLLRPVGLRTAEMLAALTNLGLDPKKLEMLGISHGGQGISFIAKNYRRITGKNVSRITGLDPSGPCFRRLGPDQRIDASDADLVDIIHTNTEGYGMAGAVGHVDFYVNGGEYQTADVDIIPCTSMCSHVKSYLLWVSALEHQDSFVALQCDTIQDARDRNCFDRPLVTNLLGPKTDVNKPGIFYLATVNYYPYYSGQKGIEKGYDIQRIILVGLNKDEVLVV